jgi:Arc/MetJ-type ribon-helix-helix transcriptional regulator
VADTEKITVNLSVVDLGKIDVLADEGLYTGRTDFVRTAIRNQLDKHQVELSQATTRHGFVVGVLSYGRNALEQLKAKGQRTRLTVIGMLILASDVTPELVVETIEHVKVRGVFRAQESVKAALADRTT